MQKFKALIIDHYDSFTYNIVDWIRPFFVTDVISYDKLKREDLFMEYDLLIFSPGPGHPQDYPLSLKLIRHWLGIKPILGICLGLQCYFEMKGVEVKRMKVPLHGKQTSISQLPRYSKFWNNVKTPVLVAHYHSLMVVGYDKSESDFILCDQEEHYVLSYENCQDRFLGVQFHPESFMTEQSDILLKNLYHWVSNE